MWPDKSFINTNKCGSRQNIIQSLYYSIPLLALDIFSLKWHLKLSLLSKIEIVQWLMMLFENILPILKVNYKFVKKHFLLATYSVTSLAK